MKVFAAEFGFNGSLEQGIYLDLHKSVDLSTSSQVYTNLWINDILRTRDMIGDEILWQHTIISREVTW